MGIEAYNEIAQRGKPDFPIQLYRVDRRHERYIMPLHWQKELEIIRVASGKLHLFINNAPYTLSAGDVAFVNCRFLHRAEPSNTVYECILCDLEMMVKKSSPVYQSYVYPIMLSQLVIEPILRPDDSSLRAEVDALFDILKEESPYYELATMGKLFSIVEKLYTEHKITRRVTTKKTTGKANVIAEIINWIDANHREHITLERLAQQSGLTPNYICRIFKEYTAKTPIEYVNAVRIENVCRDIALGGKNITEAAMDNGFNDISYFCKVFKKQKGVSAKEYLEKMHIAR